MIDSEYRFGSFVPVIPKIYKDAVSDDTTAHTDYEQKIDEANDCFIGPKWTALKLITVEPHNHDTSVFEFELPESSALLKLPITAHLLVKAPGSGAAGEDEEHVRPYTAIEECHPGRFKIMVKRYPEWGVPEAKLKQQNKTFLYAKTDHSYKPPGKVSNYIHSLSIGQSLSFKFNHVCHGKIRYPFEENITAITMIAVGAGVSPMIRILRALLHGENGKGQCLHVKKIRLLYGARTVADILQRNQLDEWHEMHTNRFQVCYCVGSRWNNIHFAAKTDQKEGPPLPVGWDSIPSDRKELGWADGEKLMKRGASDSKDEGHRVFICGLPGVYNSLVGSRFDYTVAKGSQLHRLGFRDHQVVKF
jgi:cytochrome-b5 reductase